ncbi:hypothetical protein HYW76_01720 [Candidatus Pacearchaeota archaeon]|nr:hypothetical protein [Candidatus Pacearchaeota archaeon]
MENIAIDFDSLSEEILTRYAGEWVAIINGEVICHGKSFKDVNECCKTLIIKNKPLIGKLPENSLSVLSVY